MFPNLLAKLAVYVPPLSETWDFARENIVGTCPVLYCVKQIVDLDLPNAFNLYRPTSLPAVGYTLFASIVIASLTQCRNTDLSYTIEIRIGPEPHWEQTQ